MRESTAAKRLTANETLTGKPATHFYCDKCDKRQRVHLEQLVPFMKGDWHIGNIICKRCSFVIATAYRKGD